MKYLVILSSLIVLTLVACDKVENAYPVSQTELDTSLYPGDWSSYPNPVFEPNTNTERNVLIEDFTGHKCVFCPAAAVVAHNQEENNEGRVFVSTIHTGPTGKEAFQNTSEPSSSSADFTYDFTTPQGLEIGKFFGSIPGSGFSGNPRGTVSRKKYGGNEYCYNHSNWGGAVNAFLQEPLKVNLQAKVNYYEETKGAFVHVQVDLLDKAIPTENLGLVVAFHQDSVVAPQLYPTGTTGPTFDHSADTAYVHRDILIEHINGTINGQGILADKIQPDGTYRYDYSYKIPSNHSADNAHFLLYVWDKTTYEVYQVIKAKLK